MESSQSSTCGAGDLVAAGLDWEVDAESWFECVEVIVRGAFDACQAVVAGMIERKSGRIVNIASMTGTRVFLPITATSVAKTALIRFSEGLAVQLDPYGVRVFSVHPGVVRTRLLESYGLSLPEEWYVGADRAASLCAKLANGRYDRLSGRFLGIDDDLDELLNRTDGDIGSGTLYAAFTKIATLAVHWDASDAWNTRTSQLQHLLAAGPIWPPIPDFVSLFLLPDPAPPRPRADDAPGETGHGPVCASCG